MFLVSIFFIIMNLFYAIVVSTLSDAKIEEDAKQKKKWAVLSDRFNETWRALNRGGKLQKQFRNCVPGLYSRMLKRYKRLEEREVAREDLVQKKQFQLALSDYSEKLGPGSPVWGRRTKRQLATVQVEDKMETDSEESEPDLGPLRSLEQIRPKNTMEDSFNFSQTLESLDPKMLTDGTAPDEANLADASVELILDASRHVARGIVDRTRGARVVLLDEMAESMDVLNNVSTVLEVLGKRTRDLEAQQRQILKHHWQRRFSDFTYAEFQLCMAMMRIETLKVWVKFLEVRLRWLTRPQTW